MITANIPTSWVKTGSSAQVTAIGHKIPKMDNAAKHYLALK